MELMHLILASVVIVFVVLLLSFLIHNHIIKSIGEKENESEKILKEFFEEAIVEEKTKDQETDCKDNGR